MVVTVRRKSSGVTTVTSGVTRATHTVAFVVVQTTTLLVRTMQWCEGEGGQSRARPQETLTPYRRGGSRGREEERRRRGLGDSA